MAKATKKMKAETVVQSVEDSLAEVLGSPEIIEDDHVYVPFTPPEEEVLNPIASSSQPEPVQTEPEVVIPARTSKDWTPYVLSHLDKDELVNGFPTCNGLRRIFEMLIGPIIEANAKVIQTPDKQNGFGATVEFQLIYEDGGRIKSITDATNADESNTSRPYNLFPVATSVTCAEGRCLKKGLRIAIYTAEEMNKPDDGTASLVRTINAEPAVPATDTEKNLINTISNRIGISVEKLIASKQGWTNTTLDTLTSSEARVVIKLVNDYQRGSTNGGTDPSESLFPDIK